MSAASAGELTPAEEYPSDEGSSSDEDSEHGLLERVQPDLMLVYHLSFLKLKGDEDEKSKSSTAPIFAGSLLNHPKLLPSQYGLLAGVKKVEGPGLVGLNGPSIEEDPRLFFNVTSPSSTFICGSQGSGKRHTLSCILEGCLLRSDLGRLSNPLTALVFHYDIFIGENQGSPCEAAFLASNPDVKARVLCAPTNLRSIQNTYARFNIPVKPLQIDQADLNTKRMLDLMVVQGEGTVPLYIHTMQRILRDMRMEQQKTGGPFDYHDFKYRILKSDLQPGQLDPLKQRLENLESFMPPQQVISKVSTGKKASKARRSGSDWTPEPSQLTIVDLSCPCVSSDTACLLFNICFEVFMEQSTKVGRVVALDEAHKYMKNSAEAQAFTDTLLSTVRLQRHMAVRVLISTQEPTISAELLGLCSVTIVHRFSSPAWLKALQGHVAAAAVGVQSGEQARNSTNESSETQELSSKQSLLQHIVDLSVGEALLFAPGALVGKAEEGSNELKNLGTGYMLVKIRERLTADGGKSVLSY